MEAIHGGMGGPLGGGFLWGFKHLHDFLCILVGLALALLYLVLNILVNLIGWS